MLVASAWLMGCSAPMVVTTTARIKNTTIKMILLFLDDNDLDILSNYDVVSFGVIFKALKPLAEGFSNSLILTFFKISSVS